MGVVQEMLHVFSEFGWPLTLVTDGGLNMSKAAVTNILALIGAEARVTIPGAHKQNSTAERTIWEVRQAIKKKCDKHPRNGNPFYQSYKWKSMSECENKELGVLSKERERENNKRFLVTQRKPKLKTLGD